MSPDEGLIDSLKLSLTRAFFREGSFPGARYSCVKYREKRTMRRLEADREEKHEAAQTQQANEQGREARFHQDGRGRHAGNCRRGPQRNCGGAGLRIQIGAALERSAACDEPA